MRLHHYALLLIPSLLPTSASAQADPRDTLTGPQITFEKLEHDYGTIEAGSDGHCTFTFTNTGTEPLIINRCMSSCGCVVPKCSAEPVLPGKTGEVIVLYDTKRVGPFTKSVTVHSNCVGTPMVVLRIKGTVVPRALEETPTPTTR
jgi:Protein of unknown function (DUF1573)